jgi:hypothetical protein
LYDENYSNGKFITILELEVFMLLTCIYEAQLFQVVKSTPTYNAFLLFDLLTCLALQQGFK